MTGGDSTARIWGVADLLTAAYQIESDAVERYGVLADQMETHNNPELVVVFRDLARAEGIHAEEIRRLAGDIDVAARIERNGPILQGETPEQADLASMHYLMRPRHALLLALDGEKRALAFFTSILDTAKNDDVRKMAAEFVEEEAEHVNLVQRLLRKYPADDSYPDDPDPPTSQE